MSIKISYSESEIEKLIAEDLKKKGFIPEGQIADANCSRKVFFWEFWESRFFFEKTIGLSSVTCKVIPLEKITIAKDE